VQLAGQVDARLEQPGAPLLARGYADARRERGGLAERPHRVALVVRELEAGAMAVGEDHAEPAPARGHRCAGERLDAAQPCVAPGDPALEVARDLHDPVLGQGTLRDRRLLERPVDLSEQARLEAVAPHRHNELARVVVEQQPRALHSGHAAARLAEAVVEVAAGGTVRAVHGAEQLDDHVERVGARREGLAVGHCLV
jgi:hypothetical protein